MNEIEFVQKAIEPMHAFTRKAIIKHWQEIEQKKRRGHTLIQGFTNVEKAPDEYILNWLKKETKKERNARIFLTICCTLKNDDAVIEVIKQWYKKNGDKEAEKRLLSMTSQSEKKVVKAEYDQNKEDKKYNEIKRESEKIRKENENLKKEISSRDAEIRKIKKQMAVQKAIVDSKRNEIDRINNKNKELAKEIENLANQNMALDKQVKDAKQLIKELKEMPVNRKSVALDEENAKILIFTKSTVNENDIEQFNLKIYKSIDAIDTIDWNGYACVCVTENDFPADKILNIKKKAAMHIMTDKNIGNIIKRLSNERI